MDSFLLKHITICITDILGIFIVKWNMLGTNNLVSEMRNLRIIIIDWRIARLVLRMDFSERRELSTKYDFPRYGKSSYYSNLVKSK